MRRIRPQIPELLQTGGQDDWLLALYRERFFKILAEEVPEAIEDSRASVSPVYRVAVDDLITAVRGDELELADELQLSKLFLDSWGIQTDRSASEWYLRGVATGRPEVASLRNAIEAWTTQYRLKEDWVVETIIRTLMVWHHPAEPDSDESWVTYRPRFQGALSRDEMRFAFESEWEPVIESRSSARSRILEEVAEELDRFLDEMRDNAQRRGFAPPKRPRLHNPVKDLHYLVRYQVVGENHIAIASREKLIDPTGAGRRAVSQAVHRAAKVVGLGLREPDRGALG